jgi:hypothetical protein
LKKQPEESAAVMELRQNGSTAARQHSKTVALGSLTFSHIQCGRESKF